MRKALPRSFFARPAIEVAPDLLGTVLVRTLPNGIRLAAAIVETEAYEPDDPASHSFRGQTRRNATMFGPAGHLYVYFVYGMHHCMNVVTREKGVGSAVLLRAGEPSAGVDEMMRLRGRADLICSGPARWCQAFAVDLSLDGADLVNGGGIAIRPGEDPGPIRMSPRIGVIQGADLLARFTVAGNPSVSRPRPRREDAKPWTP